MIDQKWDAWLAEQFEVYRRIQAAENRELVCRLTKYVRDRYWRFPIPGASNRRDRISYTLDYDPNFLVVEVRTRKPGVVISVIGDRANYAHLTPPLRSPRIARTNGRWKGYTRLEVRGPDALSAAQRAIAESAARRGVKPADGAGADASMPHAAEDSKSLITSRIRVDPHRLGGAPCIRDLRIRVSDVLALLSVGLTPRQVLTELPLLDEADVRACLALAATELEHPLRVA